MKLYMVFLEKILGARRNFKSSVYTYNFGQMWTLLNIFLWACGHLWTRLDTSGYFLGHQLKFNEKKLIKTITYTIKHLWTRLDTLLLPWNFWALNDNYGNHWTLLGKRKKSHEKNNYNCHKKKSKFGCLHFWTFVDIVEYL